MAAELLYFLLSSFYISFAQDVKELRYNIQDETKEGFKIADIFLDAKLDSLEEKENSTNWCYYGSYIDNEFAPYFEVDDSKGFLLTKKVIDREVLCPGAWTCQFSLNVRVTEKEDAQIIVAFCQIFVEISDLNDNSPTFPEEVFHLAISEASIPDTKFSLHVAEDLDSPPFGIQRYELLQSDSDLFDLEVVKDAERDIDVRLLLLNRLDRERKETYSVTVRAIDGGHPQRTGVLRVNITVVDMNDNNPKFNKPLYTFTVAENTPVGSYIAQVGANDADSGENGRITYNLTYDRHNHGTFEIDTNTGKIKLIKQLDYEETTAFLLTVIGQDHGSSPLKDTTKVKIKVADQNDNPPKIELRAFNQNYAHIAIYENQEPGKAVANALVTDQDSGRNGEFICQLRHPDFHLRQLYQQEYQIISGRRFDREVQSSYNITIKCHDYGIPKQYSSSMVRVQISDQNDNAPIFSQKSYRGILRENNVVSASILRVSATDTDEGRNREIAYHLDGDINELLHIDQDSGLISAKAVFDYEQRMIYNFNVTACDHGHFPKCATVPVELKVSDVNDLAPKFKLSKYAFGVYENKEVGSKVGTVFAEDLDLPPSNKFSYSLDRNEKSAKSFTIDRNSGAILTKEVLNREQQSVYHLTVYAKDTGEPPLTGTAGVIVYVGDVNDNPPTIEYPNHSNDTWLVSSQTPEDQVVYTVKASDNDVGNNAKLSFAVKGNRYRDIFYIEEWSGKIKVKKIPNSSTRFKDSNIYNLLIVVTDFGQPQQSATATLKLIIDPSLPYVPHESPKTMLRKRNLIILICVTSLATLIIIVLLVVLLCLRTRSEQRFEYKYQIPVVLPDPLSQDSYSGKVASRPELSSYWKNECPTLGSWGRKSTCRSRAASIAGSRDNFGVIEHQFVSEEAERGQLQPQSAANMTRLDSRELLEESSSAEEEFIYATGQHTEDGSTMGLQQRHYPVQSLSNADDYVPESPVHANYLPEVRPTQTPSMNDRITYSDTIPSCTVYENVDGWNRTPNSNAAAASSGYQQGSGYMANGFANVHNQM